MNTPPPINEAEVFEVATALPVGERAAYLEEACRGQLTMYARIERLLAAHGKTDFMQAAQKETSADVEVSMARLKPEEAGEQTGNYKLLQHIGEGGLGVVWIAE